MHGGEDVGLLPGAATQPPTHSCPGKGEGGAEFLLPFPHRKFSPFKNVRPIRYSGKGSLALTCTSFALSGEEPIFICLLVTGVSYFLTDSCLLPNSLFGVRKLLAD